MDKKKKEPFFSKKNMPMIIIIGIIYLICVYFIIQFCAYKTYYSKKDIFTVFEYMMEGIQEYPFTIPAPPNGAVSLIFLGTVGVILAILWDKMKRKADAHANPETSQGSAKFSTDYDGWNKVYSDPAGSTTHNGKQNAIMTQNVYLSMNTRKTRRNLNTLVVGGSGAGKSRFLVKPNLCEMALNTSFICTDPAGELLRDTGKMMEAAGYKVKVFDLVKMNLSDGYNPIHYIKTENDVMILTDCILKNTTDSSKSGGDPFWEKAQALMIQAFLFLIWRYGRKFGMRQNLEDIMFLIGNIAPDSQEGATGITVDYFNMLKSEDGWYLDENRKPTKGVPTNPSYIDSEGFEINQHFELTKVERETDITIKQYDKFRSAADKTLSSILISASSRLSVIETKEVASLLDKDTIALDKLGDEKTVLYIIISSANGTFDFLAAMMYTQLFQLLYYHAENECRGNYEVLDSNGEIVKIFELPVRMTEKAIDKSNLQEIEIDLDKMADDAMYTAKINSDIQKVDNDGIDEELLGGLEKVAFNKVEENNPLDTLPDDDPGMADKVTEEKAKDFAERCRFVRTFGFGDEIHLKIPPTGKKYLTQEEANEIDTSEWELIGIYSGQGVAFAKKRIQYLKNCTVKQIGAILPFHVRFLLDEFANIGQIPDFSKKLATMRKYEISCTIITQNIAQLKNMYKDDYSTIIGNCDSFLFLGASDMDTLEYVSKMLGDTTITVKSKSVSKGSKGNLSNSYSQQKRALRNPNELREMDNTKCIYVMRGERPFEDEKFDYEKHPNFQYTADYNSKSFTYIQTIRRNISNKKDDNGFTNESSVIAKEYEDIAGMIINNYEEIPIEMSELEKMYNEYQNQLARNMNASEKDEEALTHLNNNPVYELFNKTDDNTEDDKKDNINDDANHIDGTENDTLNETTENESEVYSQEFIPEEKKSEENEPLLREETVNSVQQLLNAESSGLFEFDDEDD